jgi:cobalt-precorrin 5A hydrolase
MLDIITLSSLGLVVAQRLKDSFVDAVIHLHEDVASGGDTRPFSSTSDLVAELFPKTKGIVFIGPCGIAVRALAPLIKSKLSDPPVVVVDVMGRYAVSLLSGHEGGANDLACDWRRACDHDHQRC